MKARSSATDLITKPLMPDWIEAPDGESITFLDDDGSYLGRAVKEYGPVYELTTGEWSNWCWCPVDDDAKQLN